MDAAGVPIVPGVTEPVPDVEAARPIAERIGYPVAVKASAGGGGKGFRVALTPDRLSDAFEGAVREGERFFADGAVYLERYLPEPRHVEIQVFADAHGNCIHLGERDCSVQRRHQKLVEETPSPVVSDDLRRRMGEASVTAARAVDYRGAGTLEYLVSGEEFFFLEMNTRIQVEHTVTEAVTGLDLVREQIRVAAGEPLSVTQEEVRAAGPRLRVPHQRGGRVPASSCPPPPASPPTASPSGPGVRVDSGVRAGSDIPEIYDPMVAKLIVWDVDREAARRRMLRALSEYVVEGPATLIPFHRWLLSEQEFIDGGACHALLAKLADEPTPVPSVDGGPAVPGDEAPEAEPQAERRFTAEVEGRRFEVALRYTPPEGGGAGAPAAARAPKEKRKRSGGSGGGGTSGEVVTPMQGTVLKVLVEPGQEVAAGDVVCIVEAMKMENEVPAVQGGSVQEVRVEPGQSVSAGDILAVII